jgi:hypothetical protein
VQNSIRWGEREGKNGRKQDTEYRMQETGDRSFEYPISKALNGVNPCKSVSEERGSY